MTNEELRFEPLSINQKTFLTWLRASPNLTTVQNKLNVNKGTLLYWMKNDEFKEEVNNLMSGNPDYISNTSLQIEIENEKNRQKKLKELRKKVQHKAKANYIEIRSWL